LVSAADDPIELLGEPGGTGGINPDGKGGPADGDDALIAVVAGEAVEPVGSGHGVIVNEGDDLTGGGADVDIPGLGEAPNPVIQDYPDGRGELGLKTRIDLGGMVDGDDQLIRRMSLGADGSDGLADIGQAVHGIAADDDGYPQIGHVKFHACLNGLASEGMKSNMIMSWRQIQTAF
jgi:hypothetical protein